jgi:hypothetical protein
LEGNLGTALKLWYKAWLGFLQTTAITVTSWTDAGFVKNNGSGVLSGGNLLAAADLPAGPSGDWSVPVGNAFYIGSISVDGSWRFVIDSGNLSVQKREGGSWVEKGSFLS